MKYRRLCKVNTFLFLSIIFLLVICSFIFFEINIRPTINSVAVAKAKNIAIKAVNDIVTTAMSECSITYNDLIIFRTDDQNRITAVSSNSVAINKLKSELNIRIQEKIATLSDFKTKIPLGTLLNQSILSGLGPKITIRMIPVGYTNIDIKSDFVSAGINQTKHVITLEINTKISVLLPISATSADVTTHLAIAETIIIGSVPDTYTNIGQTDNTPDDIALNMIP